MTSAEEIRQKFMHAGECVAGFSQSIGEAAAGLREGDLDDEFIIALASEGEDVPYLVILGRLEKNLATALDAAREYRKEMLLALHRAKRPADGR